MSNNKIECNETIAVNFPKLFIKLSEKELQLKIGRGRLVEKSCMDGKKNKIKKINTQNQKAEKQNLLRIFSFSSARRLLKSTKY